ncbi:hypothetical protein P7K49_005769 [Saguinus oedipus]|uniref:Uncharacterized protein n=1 Tax=Saguinus oedipus TaxID=9490 RepID=A0ABQ9W0H2_SAGOE|nr:hypothetical protein P7K49_005769 [Saguinus oedipus]
MLRKQGNFKAVGGQDECNQGTKGQQQRRVSIQRSEWKPSVTNTTRSGSEGCRRHQEGRAEPPMVSYCDPGVEDRGKERDFTELQQHLPRAPILNRALTAPTTGPPPEQSSNSTYHGPPSLNRAPTAPTTGPHPEQSSNSTYHGPPS